MSAMNDAIPADDLPNAPRSDQNDELTVRHDGETRWPAVHDTSSAADLDRPARVDRRPLVIAMAITTTFFIVEVVGAYVSNSLALLADAAHMLTDVAAIGLALFAMWLAGRPTRAERTFGYLRAEILAALVNAVSLIVMAIYIFWEAWQRLQEPPEVESGPLLVVAVAGLLANIAAAWV